MRSARSLYTVGDSFGWIPPLGAFGPRLQCQASVKTGLETQHRHSSYHAASAVGRAQEQEQAKTYDNRLPVVVEDLPERKTCKDVKHKCQTGHDIQLLTATRRTTDACTYRSSQSPWQYHMLASYSRSSKFTELCQKGNLSIVAQAEYGQRLSIPCLESLLHQRSIQPSVGNYQSTASTTHPAPGTPPYLRTFSLPSRFPDTIVSGEAEGLLGQTSDHRTCYDGIANASTKPRIRLDHRHETTHALRMMYR